MVSKAVLCIFALNNRTMRLYLLATVLCFATLSSFAQEKEIHKCFEEYKSAILKEKGNEAVGKVSKSTIAYYEKSRVEALEADSATVANLTVIDKIMVLTLRSKMSANELSAMNGRTLFEYSVDQGMVGKNSVANGSIGEIKMKGENAEGYIAINGEVSPIFFLFSQENGEWKIDLTSVFDVSNEGMKQMIDATGYAENDYVIMVLQMATGAELSSSIWQPLK